MAYINRLQVLRNGSYGFVIHEHPDNYDHLVKLLRERLREAGSQLLYSRQRRRFYVRAEGREILASMFPNFEPALAFSEADRKMVDAAVGSAEDASTQHSAPNTGPQAYDPDKRLGGLFDPDRRVA